MISARQLTAIMPRCPADKLEQYSRCLSAACTEAQISTVTRSAAFLGQLAHESGELRWWEEQSDGSQYEGRASLGNVSPGDGARYKGRGPIQLTGRANYAQAGAALSLGLEGAPEMALQPEVGFRVAGWYWTTRKCNAFADALDFEAITRAINGGLSGYDRRLAYYRHALEVLGVDAAV